MNESSSHVLVNEWLREKRLSAFDGEVSRQGVDQAKSALEKAGLSSREAFGLSLENGSLCTSIYLAALELDLVPVPLAPTQSFEEREELWNRLHLNWAWDTKGLHSRTNSYDALKWPHEVTWILHSSGSTGLPKPIALSFTSFVKNAKDSMKILGRGPQVLHLGSMSQCYTNGLYNSFMLPLLTEGRALIGPVVTGFKFKKFLELIQTHQPEILWVNPAVVQMFLKMQEVPKLSEKALLVSCTAPLSKFEAIQAEAKLQRKVLQSYGLTETLIVSIESPHRSLETQFSAGRILGGRDAIIYEEDTRRLKIQNGSVSPGYIQINHGQIELGFPEGHGGKLYIANDTGQTLESENLQITGRLSNVINVLGAKISAEAIEEVLRSHPEISDAGVCGLQGPDGFERPVAAIETSRTLNTHELADLCAQQLGPKARPSVFISMPKLPRTSNGKLNRVALKEELQKQV